jgi:hypothetical protein
MNTTTETPSEMTIDQIIADLEEVLKTFAPADGGWNHGAKI